MAASARRILTSRKDVASLSSPGTLDCVDHSRRMQEDFDARLDAIAKAIEMGLADETTEALAAERFRSDCAAHGRRLQTGA